MIREAVLGGKFKARKIYNKKVGVTAVKQLHKFLVAVYLQKHQYEQLCTQKILSQEQGLQHLGEAEKYEDAF